MNGSLSLLKFADQNTHTENELASPTTSSNNSSSDLDGDGGEEKEILAEIKKAELNKNKTESEDIDGEKIKGFVCF